MYHVIRESCYTSWLTECLLDSDSSHRFTHQPRRIETGETRVLTEGLRGPNITGALSLVVKPVVLYHRAKTAASLHKKKKCDMFKKLCVLI